MLMARRIVLYVGTHMKTIQPLQQVSSTGTCVLNLISSGMSVVKENQDKMAHCYIFHQIWLNGSFIIPQIVNHESFWSHFSDIESLKWYFSGIVCVCVCFVFFWFCFDFVV